MASTEQLIAYTMIDCALSLKLPSYDNTTFTTATRTVSSPLVSIQKLKSHLWLLGMLALMKQKVEVPSLDPQLMETIPLLAKALSQQRDGCGSSGWR